MCWEEFSVALDRSIVALEQRYFQINRFNAKPTWRERAYCYELYHQLRHHLGEDFRYTLHGEIDKRGHKDICKEFNNIRPNPDFVAHDPGERKNLVVMEVKPSTCNKIGAQKDINKLEIFINKIRYQHGIFLIFGSEKDVHKLVDKLIINEELICNGQLCVLWHQRYRGLPKVIKGSFNHRTISTYNM